MVVFLLLLTLLSEVAAGAGVARGGLAGRRQLLQGRAFGRGSQNELNFMLLQASKGPSLAEVQRAVAAGASIAIVDEYGWSPLHFAAVANAEVVQYLISKRADVNAETLSIRTWMGRDTSEGSTPLHLASIYGNLDAQRVLLSSRANVDARDGDGDTPLHAAVFHEQINAAQVLFAAGVDINVKNANGWTPLYLAARFGQANVVEFLLDSGADKTIPDNSGFLPVDSICTGNPPCPARDVEILNSLLQI